jgi:FdhD protein
VSDRRPVDVVRPDGAASDIVCVEEPLEVRVEDEPIAVTLRTPGHDRELAAGLLHTLGILERLDDLVALEPLAGDPLGNTIVARVSGGVQAHAAQIRTAARAFFASSACGVCGGAALPRVEASAPPLHPWAPSDALLAGLADALRGDLFADTHGAHAAALVRADGTTVLSREDIGRHNAVDKVLGRAFLDGRDVRGHLLLVSGRAGFEIVHKARVAGVPAVASIGAASSLAIDLARSSGMSLVGFLRTRSWTRYC